MFGNPSNKNTNPQNNNLTPSLFNNTSSNQPNPSNPSPLFGSSSGGLFAQGNTSGGLFSNVSNNSLKTSERKQGGLFGSSNVSKPSSSDEAPKLLFGGIGGNPAPNSLFGANSTNKTDKQQQTPSANTLFPKPSGSLFANNTTPAAGGLFANITPFASNTVKEEASKQTKGGLFASTTVEQKQQIKQKPTGGLFGNSSKNELFKGIANSGFEAPSQKGGLFAKTTDSSLFTNKNEALPLFGGLTTKKQQDKKEQPNLFNLNAPSTPLFGKSTPLPQNNQQQKLQFSLTGGIASSLSPSAGLFSKKQTDKKLNPSFKVQVSNLNQTGQKKPNIGLFANPVDTKQKDQVKPQTSLFSGTGGLFTNQNAEQKKAEQKSIKNDKKQGSNESGSLFSLNNKDQDKKKQTPISSGLFAGSSLLFNKQTTAKNQQKSQLNMNNDKQNLQQNKTQRPQKMLATFSRQKINENINEDNGLGQKRTNRTISFNESLNKNQQNKNQSPKQIKPTITSSLFNDNKKNQDNKTQNKTPISLTQSTTKPVQSTSQNATKSKKMMQQSFFKQQNIKKQLPSPTIFTAFQINNLLKLEMSKKSTGPSSRYGGQKLQKNFIKNIQDWIQTSFSRYNQVPTTQMLQKKFTLHTNQDINKFLNDVVRQVILIVNLPLQQKSFKFINKLFFELLQKFGIKQTLFVCTKVQIPAGQVNNNSPSSLEIVQLNNGYFVKHQIYKFTHEGTHLNLDSQQLQRYVLSLTKKFTTNQLQYLQYIQNKVQLLKLPSRLFYQLISYCLKYKKTRLSSSNIWKQKNSAVISLIQDFQKKIISKMITLLSGFIDSNFYDFLLINKQHLPEFIQLVQDFSYTEQDSIIHLSLKVILNNLGMGSPSTSNKLDLQLNPQTLSSIKQTKSLQLLPFRTLAAIHQNKSYRTIPSAHDLYRYIQGPQWLDWLQIYLGNGSGSTQKEISVHEARYMIKILKYPILNTKKINRQKLSPKQARYVQNIETKVLNRKRPIYKYINSLKQENLLNNFYQILMSIMFDYESYRKIQELFFRQKDQFNYEFRNVIAEICNYPTQKFKEQIPFLQQKVLYFLKIVQVAPEKTLALQKLVFEGTPLPQRKVQTKDDKYQPLQLRDKLQFEEIGHKICHLIIDTINYFGLKNNQKIVGKCISAIKSLLQNQETTLSMKIAMAVNKPQMSFISNSLLSPNQYRLIQSVIIQMTELLEFILISEQFPQTLALCLYTNNSQDAHLQRMYSVRYSNKDYLPFAKQMIQHHNDNKMKKNGQYKLSYMTITYSSYWILKALQVFVQGFKQQKTFFTSNGKSSLYLMSIILQKLFIPISHRVQYKQLNSKMMQQSIQRINNPIYSNSSSNQIPKVLLYLTQALNTIDIMSILSQNLKYKLLKSGHNFQSQTNISTKNIKYYLTNQKLQQDYQQNSFTVYLSVKILKQILEIYRVYEQYKNSQIRHGQQLLSNENNFVYKLLTRLRWIQDIQFNLFLKGYSKNDIIDNQNNTNTNIIIGIISLLMINNKNEISQIMINQNDQFYQSNQLNLKLQNYQKPYIVPIENNNINTNNKKSIQLYHFNHIETFYTQYASTLNFQVVNNFLILATNPYLQSIQSLQNLVIQSLALMISGQTLFGTKSSNTALQSTINIAKYIGLYNNFDISNDLFSNLWLLENFQNQLYYFLSSKNSSLQLKYSILDFLYQIIKSQKSNNFIFAKKIVYKYLIKHLDQFNIYSEEQVNRLNLIVIKILNILEQRDYFIFRQQVNDKFIDTLLGSMLKTCQKCLKSSTNLLKLIKSFSSKAYQSPELAYYHLQRACEERQIIKTGQSYQILKWIIQLIQKRFFDVKSTRSQGFQNNYHWKSIKKVNSLLITFNLVYIASIIHDSSISKLSIKHIHQEQANKYYFNTNLPHNFGKNHFQMYLTQAKTSEYIQTVFDVYKQNVVDWISFSSMRLGQRILKFINWILTVDKNLYGNQPVSAKIRQLQINKQESIICSMHMGNYRHTAVQLFADSQNQAINMVKNLYDESLRNLEKGMTINQGRSFSIMGYCLEWIRARQNTYDILEHLTRNTIKNPFWIDRNSIKNAFVIKFILSLVSIGGQILSTSDFRNLRVPILDIINKFKDNKSQSQQSLIQQLISILISIPPQLQDSHTINQIVNIWKTQTNNQFFYNQSRLILQLSNMYPNQLAKLKALRSCEKIKKSVSSSHYSYNLRYPDSIAFTWGLKIASNLMSSELETALIFQEISEFYNLKCDQIYNLLLWNTSTIALVHIEELQALLEFILTLISSQSWVTVHRKQFQKLTYVLSHKLINLFMDFINSKISFAAQSDMQKRFKKIRFESYVDQLKDQSQKQIYESNIDNNSVFRMFIELKMIQCMKTFILTLTRCFEQSWYVHKYFNEQVYENYRYGVSFWDRINKSITDLIKFSVNVQKKWRKSDNLNQKLLLIQDCINSSQFFVQTGYLSSLFNISINNKELFEEFQELNRFCLQLGTVHLIQEKAFRQKYQCLMKGNIQKFGKKLMQNVKIIQDQSEQSNLKQDNGRAKQKKLPYFQNVSINIANLIKTV